MSSGTISLYFGLQGGQRADLEVVAKAAIDWVESVRAAANALEPGANIRVEILDAEESSLTINAVLEWAEAQLARIEEGTAKYRRITRLAVGLAIFVPTVGLPTYDFYFGEKPSSMSEDDRKLLKEFLTKIKDDPDVAVKRQKFFKGIERDKAISGAGISEGSKEKPLILIPRAQFAEQSGVWAILAEDDQRTTYPVYDVVLVAPALVATPRAWRFQAEGLPEFSATMKDAIFLDALKHENIRERLRIGIPMTIRLKVEEKKIDGVWIPKPAGRSVIEVISPKTR